MTLAARAAWSALAATVAAVVAVAGARALLIAWGPSVEAQHAGATLIMGTFLLAIGAAVLAAVRGRRAE